MDTPPTSYFIPGVGYLPNWWLWGPIGDIYPLEPVWSEHHVAQSLIVSAKSEEIITQHIVIPEGFDWAMLITLTDLGVDLVSSLDDEIPTGYVRTVSSLTSNWGWSTTHQFAASPVMDDTVEPVVWTGAVLLEVDTALQSLLGTNRAWDMKVQVVLDEGAGEFPVDVLVGTFVVRKQ